MKVLFLDFDGVLNTPRWVADSTRLVGKGDRWSYDKARLDPKKIALVDEVCRRTGAKIVFSTSWRFEGISPDYMHGLLVEHGFTGEHAGETPRPVEIDPGGILVVQCRGDEIKGYLRSHPEVEVFAIIDDMGSPAFPGLGDRLVRTSTCHGIHERDVDLLVTLLGEV